jgi:DNA polymerase-1
MSNICLIDGANLAYRAYHVFSKFKSSKGIHTGGIYGFFNMLISYARVTDKFIIAWEGSKDKNWRRKEYPQYKEKRKEINEEMIECFHNVKDLCTLIGIPQIRKDEYEADDCIEYLVRRFQKDITIISNDKDLLQLISDENNIKVLRPHPKDGLIKYDEDMIKTKYGVSKEQFILYLSILGDTSDNIKGIKGFGEVKTCRFINGEIEPLKTLESMYPTEIENVKRNIRLIDLKNHDNRIKSIEDDELILPKPNLYLLNNKLFEYEIKAINSKDLIDSLRNDGFISSLHSLKSTMIPSKLQTIL